MPKDKAERPIVHVELRKMSSVVGAGNFLRDSVCCFCGNASKNGSTKITVPTHRTAPEEKSQNKNE